MKFRVTASTDSVKRKLQAVERKTEAPDETYLRWLRRSAEIIRGFWFRRFDRFSRGGGNWKVTKRRKATRGRRRAFILRVTHTLLRALSPRFRSLPGQWERIRGNAIVTGYGGGKRHPQAKLTVRRLAEIHNEGLGVVARRQIIVRPDKQTREQIVKAGQRLKRG